MHAAVLKKYGRLLWEEVPDPSVKDDEVLVKVAYAGICGSDMHLYHGDFSPRTRLPLIPGHEFSGMIVKAGKHVHQYNKGDRVVVDPIVWCGACAACQIRHYPACSSLKLIGIDMDGGFAEYVAVPQTTLYRIPETISYRNAALVEVYSIGFHACNRAQLKKGDTVAIWGTGRIGQSILQAARTITESLIFCIDVLPQRLAMAKQAFPDIVTIDSSTQDPVSVIREMTNDRGVDAAFEAVGHAVPVPDRPNPVQGCVRSIRGAGTVCVLGLGDIPSSILTKELIWKEAKIIASRVSHGEFKQAIEHLQAGRLQPDAMISAEFSGNETQHAFSLLEKHPDKYVKVLLKMHSAKTNG
ncbi:alcohol dehydrogenase catalytic domain-containing protein [bacterium]|nr:alcohol dehydrogenase catalytic domain-containing protein [bacterium]